MRRKLTSAPATSGRDISGPIPPGVFVPEVWIEVGRPKSSWQQQRIISHLAEMYPGGVPADIPRKQLLRELGQREPALAQADLKTLRRAINAYHAKLGIK